jgi:DNA repair exonuclease SbcCD ATPase subunit
MKRFWVIVIIIVIACGILFALTYSVPQIKDVANELARNKVPFWLIGLLAPIMYLFRNLGKSLSNLLPRSGEEEDIKNENERITKELERINNEVSRLDTWRKNEIDIQMKEIERLKVSIKMLTEASRTLDSNIERIKEKDPASFTEGKSAKEIFDGLNQYLGIQ